MTDPAARTRRTTRFKLIVKRGDQVVEEFDGRHDQARQENVVTVVKEQSKLIQLEEVGTGQALEQVPAKGSVALAGGADAGPSALDARRLRRRPPTAPASAGSRRSTRSRWSRSPT